MGARLVLVTVLIVALSSAIAAQCELSKLDSSAFGPGAEPQPSDRFGWSLDASGDVVAVGAPFNDEPGEFNVGAVYVYRHDGTSLQPEQRLLPDATTGPGFGFGVFLNGDRLLTSAGPGLTEFSFDGSTWNPSGSLVIAPPGVIATDGEVLVSGSPSELGEAGEARVHRRGPGGWAFEQLIPNPLAGVTDHFGSAVAVSGDVLAIGASGRGSAFGASQGLGVVHVYRDGPGGWTLEDSVSASDEQLDDLFAVRCALSGDTLAVSATHTEELFPGTAVTANNNGAVYIYRDDGAGNWVEEQKVFAEIVGNNINFGRSLDLDGDVLVAGSSALAPFAGSGDIAVFHRRNGTWFEDVDPVPAEIDFFDGFGISVAVSGELVVGGADGHDTGNVDGSGAAWAFDVHPIIDLGQGLAGFGGMVPALSLSDSLCPDGTSSVSLADSRPSSSAWLVFGVSFLGAPFKGGTLVPDPDLLVAGLPLSGTGELSFPFTWPAGFPGIETWWQFAVQDVDGPAGWALSNALTVTSGGL